MLQTLILLTNADAILVVMPLQTPLKNNYIAATVTVVDHNLELWLAHSSIFMIFCIPNQVNLFMILKICLSNINSYQFLDMALH